MFFTNIFGYKTPMLADVFSFILLALCSAMIPSSRGSSRGTRGAGWEEALLALRALPRPPSHWDGWRLARLEPMKKRDYGKMEEDLGDEKLETKSQLFFDRKLLW